MLIIFHIAEPEHGFFIRILYILKQRNIMTSIILSLNLKNAK